MLIIGRKRDQKIVIADNIVITILEIGRNRVRFGIEAPKEVPIHTRQQSAPGSEAVSREQTVTPSDRKRPEKVADSDRERREETLRPSGSDRGGKIAARSG